MIIVVGVPSPHSNNNCGPITAGIANANVTEYVKSAVTGEQSLLGVLVLLILDTGGKDAHCASADW
ncbi:MAG TPA: hypothetical protein PK325_07415 [Cyclobacteriaceae bacterium]|nr:hypothetical protein [Cyclobacteriaceae bacterium]